MDSEFALAQYYDTHTAATAPTTDIATTAPTAATAVSSNHLRPLQTVEFLPYQ